MDTDKEQIETIIKQMMEGFAHGDADQFAAAFQADAGCIIRDGTYFQGKEAIMDAHKVIFNSIYSKGTISTYEIENIRYLAGTVMLARIKGHMEFGINQQKQEVNGRISLVFHKSEDSWQIALFQNTSVLKPVSKN